MHWSAAYIGLPYVPGESDCAMLVERVEREVFGRALDLPKERPSDRARDMAAQIGEHLERFARRLPAGTDPREGDLVLMVGAGYLDHIGVYAEIAGEAWVLHAFIRARQTVLHRLRELRNWGLEVEGVYAWH